MKRCTTCRQTKPLDEFYREGTGSGRTPRLKSSCKECHRSRVRREAKTPQAVAARRARYSNGGARKQKESLAALREAHFFKWRARLWSSRWHTKVSAAQLARLWMDQGGRCALSGRKLGRDAHLDHIVAVTNGGDHGIANLRWLDPWVNVARQNLTDEEFLARCTEVASWITARCLETLEGTAS